MCCSTFYTSYSISCQVYLRVRSACGSTLWRHPTYDKSSPQNMNPVSHAFIFYGENLSFTLTLHIKTFTAYFPSILQKVLTCCSRVITVCMRKFPLSHGSVMPTEPGRKSPAASIWRQRLHCIWTDTRMLTNNKYETNCSENN